MPASEMLLVLAADDNQIPVMEFLVDVGGMNVNTQCEFGLSVPLGEVLHRGVPIGALAWLVERGAVA